MIPEISLCYCFRMRISCLKFYILFCSLVCSGELFGWQSGQLANQHLERSESFRLVEQYDSALWYCQKASLEFLKVKDREGWMRSHLKGNTILKNQRKFGEAVALLDSVIKIISKNDPSEKLSSLVDLEKKRFIWMHIQLGYVAYRDQQYLASSRAYQKAKSYYKANCIIGKSDCMSIDYLARFLYYPLALVYYEIGDGVAILELLDSDIMKIFENGEIKMKQKWLNGFYNLIGSAYRLNGDTHSALNYFDKAYQMNNLPPFQKARSIFMLGEGFRKEKKYPKARKLVNEGLNFIQETDFEWDLASKQATNPYLFGAYIALDEGDHAEALGYAQQGLSYLERLDHEQTIHSESWINNYIALGVIHNKKEEYEKAISYFQLGYNTLKTDQWDVYSDSLPDRKRFHPDPSLSDIFSEMGMAMLGLGMDQGKSLYLERAVDLFDLTIYCEDLAKNLYRSEEARVNVMRSRKKYLAKAIDACYALWKETRNPKYVNKALLFIEKSRAQEIANELAKKEIRKKMGVPDSLMTDRSLAYRDWKFAELTYTESPSDSLWKLVENFREQYRMIDNQINEISNIYSNDLSQTYASLESQTIDSLKDEFKNQSGMISMYSDKANLYLVYLSTEFQDIKKIGLDSEFKAKVDEAVEIIRIREPSCEQKRIFARIGHELFRAVVAPLYDKGTENILVLPDSLFYHLPLDVLLTNKMRKDSILDIEYYEFPYAWKEIQFYYDYSLWMSLTSSSFSLNDHAYKQDYIGFAPAYDASNARITFDPSRGGEKLPYNSSEVDSTAEVLRILDYKTITFIDNEANKQVFLDNLENGRILHLSLHSVPSGDAGIRYSYLIFAESGSMDNNLYVYEIYEKDISALFMIIGACESALGLELEGEGVLSIGRSFRYAGVPGMMVSMWKVDDFASSYLVPAVMRHLNEGKEKACALQEARWDYFKNESFGDKKMTPYHWGQYVIYGNNESIFENKIPETVSNHGSYRIYLWLFLILGIGLVIISLLGFSTNKQG